MLKSVGGDTLPFSYAVYMVSICGSDVARMSVQPSLEWAPVNGGVGGDHVDCSGTLGRALSALD